MAIDLEKGLAISIGGELGKHSTLPIDVLIEISASLQDLVQTIAKTDITADQTFDLNNFKIELSDFKPGSAVPEFMLTPRILPTVNSVTGQRKEVAQKLSRMLGLVDKENFSVIRELYPDASRRNAITEAVYKFTQSFQNAPVHFGELNSNGVFTPQYKLHRLKKSLRDSLITDITDVQSLVAEKEGAYATVRIITKSGKKPKTKVQSVIKKDKHSLSYSPDFITVNNRKYIFNFPLRSLLEKEKGHFVIQNEMLDIHATGRTEGEAEQDFNEEFDYLYQRLNELEADNLTARLNTIKLFINHFVRSVTPW